MTLRISRPRPFPALPLAFLDCSSALRTCLLSARGQFLIARWRSWTARRGCSPLGTPCTPTLSSRRCSSRRCTARSRSRPQWRRCSCSRRGRRRPPACRSRRSSRSPRPPRAVRRGRAGARTCRWRRWWSSGSRPGKDGRIRRKDAAHCHDHFDEAVRSRIPFVGVRKVDHPRGAYVRVVFFQIL